jgi:hypothetical protein
MKNFNDTIENRTRDLPVCSAVPQPTAPPRAPLCTFISAVIHTTSLKSLRSALNIQPFKAVKTSRLVALNKHRELRFIAQFI